eukprot:11090772-Ditylum_brightwellii.AAC.1
MPTSYAPPPQIRLLLSTSSPYLSSMTDHQRNGSSFDVACLQYQKARTSPKAQQVRLSQRPCLKAKP